MRAPVVALFALLFVASAAAAQRPSEVVRWSAVGPAAAVKAGGELRLRLTAEIEAGWHLYAMAQPKGGPQALEFKSAAGQPLDVQDARVEAPLPRIAPDDNFGLETQFYDETTTFEVPVKLAATAAAGKRTLSVDVRFQACSRRLCLRPTTERVRLEMTVAARQRGSKE